MKTIGFTIIFIILAVVTGFSQVEIQWQKCLGGTNPDRANSIQPTSDGGYIVAGSTYSNDGDVSGNHGLDDVWVVKLSVLGEFEWQKCLGGTNPDEAYSIQQTSDGGYVVAGVTDSDNGDVSGNHGDTDIWVVKLDDQGNIEWQKCLGGSDNENASSLLQTHDGGYILVGVTESNDGDVVGNHGSSDVWVVKLDCQGNIQGKRCLGGTQIDAAYSIQLTLDGGFIVAGATSSNNGDVSGNHGGEDMWIVKFDFQGNLQWQKCLGGTGYETACFIQQSQDLGYIVSGSTGSNDGDVSGNNGSKDMWIVKLDDHGILQWQKCLGGTESDISFSIQQTFDGGYITAGWTLSNNGNVIGNHGEYDSWVVKLDSLGILEWQKCLGGTSSDAAHSIQQTMDGGYIVAGWTNSNDYDVSGNHGNSDIWVEKLSLTTQTPILASKINLIYPNPSSDILHIVLPDRTTSVEVYNTSGEKVKELVPQREVAEIGVKDLPAGLYVVRMYCANGVVTTKFVRE